MRRILIGLKVLALGVVTGLSALPPAVVWLVTLGARGPSSWLGSRCCVLWSRAALRITGVRLTVEGRPRNGTFLVAANHLSYLDIWVLGSLYPTAFVAKREISSWPVFGGIASIAGTLFIDRDSGRSLVRTSRAMRAHLERGLSLTLFAEGKASRGDTVQPFMPSLFDAAARLDVPCYGASLTYDAPGSPDPPARTVCWWSSQNLIKHVAVLLSLPRVEARVRFSAEPIVSTDRKELSRRLHREVADSFVPVRQVPLA